MKCITGQGVGTNVRQAAASSKGQEELLWNLNPLGAHSASTLLNTMVFLIGKNFSIRSGKEHRRLKFSQFTLEPPCGDEPEGRIYTSFGEKNNLGGLNIGRSSDSVSSITQTKYVLSFVWSIYIRNICRYVNAYCLSKCLHDLYQN